MLFALNKPLYYVLLLLQYQDLFALWLTFRRSKVLNTYDSKIYVYSKNKGFPYNYFYNDIFLSNIPERSVLFLNVDPC